MGFQNVAYAADQQRSTPSTTRQIVTVSLSLLFGFTEARKLDNGGALSTMVMLRLPR
jgi:hypothetical protein